jgi:hypothetical protein
VAEQLLDRPSVIAGFEEMRRKSELTGLQYSCTQNEGGDLTITALAPDLRSGLQPSDSIGRSTDQPIYSISSLVNASSGSTKYSISRSSSSSSGVGGGGGGGSSTGMRTCR